MRMDSQLVMRTTITIDDAQLKELMASEPDASVSEAIRRAIEEKVRRRKVDEFLGLAGKYPHLHTEAERANKLSVTNAKRTHR